MMLNLLRAVRDWFWRVLVASDVWLNTVSGGDDDATISLRCAQAARQGSRGGKVMCRILDFFNPGHCVAQFSTEEGIEDDAPSR